jgi:chemotaxis protein methyltransferase CheR
MNVNSPPAQGSAGTDLSSEKSGIGVAATNMSKRVFNRFREIVYEKAGISLSEKKHTLVCSRLRKRMRKLDMDDFDSYLERVESDESGTEIVELLDAISTNVTRFFRESEHFDFLSEAIDEWARQGQERFRFWSAACSTGEEPYCIAMTASEALGGGKTDCKVLATDISTRALKTALRAQYPPKKVKGVETDLLDRYFSKKRIDGEKLYQVKSWLRRCVIFRRANLAKPPFPMSGPFDAIFVRNVMIYFDNRVRKQLLEEVRRLLRPNGYLFVGHAESLVGHLADFTAVRPSIYVKD